MKYGCHDRKPHIKSYPAPDGHWLDGHSYVIKATNIKVTGTKTCQFTRSDLGRVDPRCDGCRHKQVLSTEG